MSDLCLLFVPLSSAFFLQPLYQVKTGFVLKIICVLVANASVNTLGIWIFDAGTFPSWLNNTATAMPDLNNTAATTLA